MNLRRRLVEWVIGIKGKQDIAERKQLECIIYEYYIFMYTCMYEIVKEQHYLKNTFSQVSFIGFDP